MKIINGFKVNMYVRIGDQPPKNLSLIQMCIRDSR